MNTEKTNLENETPPISNVLLPAVYWLVVWLGCCLILGSIFYSNIQHQKRVDKIFHDYYKEISAINGR
jgi:hypothetical protein